MNSGPAASARDRPGRLFPPPPLPTYFDPDPSWLRLDNNTNPRAHPVVRRIGRLARSAELNRYGTVTGGRLRGALARYYGVAADRFLVGNGSDELLDTAARAFLRPGRVGGMLRPGYDIYAALIRRQGARLAEWPLGTDLSVPEFRRLEPRPDLLYLASPHNPTGGLLAPRDLVEAARFARCAVVVDEAYAEYGRGRLWATGFRTGKVVFTRTFSKAWGLAGLRIGYAVGPAPLVERLRRFQIPFTLGTLPEAVASEALQSTSFLTTSVARVRRERPRLARALGARGFRVFPSAANFLFTYPPMDGQRLWEGLRDLGVLVRRTTPTAACACPLRITVGTPRDSAVLLRAVDRILAAPPSGGSGEGRP